MLNKLPTEILLNILSHTDLHTLSNMCCVNRHLNQTIMLYKWEIIDNFENCELINNSDKKEYIYIPKNIETYMNYQYIIDFTVLIYYKIKIKEDAIKELYRYIDLDSLCRYQKFSNELLCSICKYITIDNLFTYQDIPIDLLFEIVENNDITDSHWRNICKYQTLSSNFILKYIQFIDWRCISQNKKCINEFVVSNFPDNLIWQEVTKHGLSMYVIENNLERFDAFCWINISYHSVLNADFIYKYYDKLDFLTLVSVQKLDEKTILFLIEKSNDTAKSLLWSKIATSQKLSLTFLIKYKQFLSRTQLIRNRKIKRNFIYQNDM